jgi:hypothetical protein
VVLKLNLHSDNLSKIRAKRSSSEALIKRSAPDTDRNGIWINGAKIVPELIADLLTDGHKVKFKAPGRSMHPTIRHGDIIVVEPISPTAVTVGDIILYQNKLGVVAHRVVEIIKRKGPQTPLAKVCCSSIGNSETCLQRSEKYSNSAPQGVHNCSCRQNRAGSSTSETLQFIFRGDASRTLDEPVDAQQILGKVIFVERNGRRVDPYTLRANLFLKFRRLATALRRFVPFYTKLAQF